MIFDHYDIVVVGAGHAGCEASAAAANLGSKVLLITMNLLTIGQMSCNPSIGGVGKGQITREIDALGGYTALVSDKSMVQFRMLNKSKGPAMWSPRAQNDRLMFHVEWRKVLESIPNVHFLQDQVVNLIVKNRKILGVVTGMGNKIYCKAVIITSGTFLNGKIHIGEKNFSGGRIAETSVSGLTEIINRLEIKSGRLKTGTPPRIDSRSIDFSKLTQQVGDKPPGQMSFREIIDKENFYQLPCYITYTNSFVHEILKKGFDRSPLFTGRIQGVGPRYCPSIEDKIQRFSSKDSHQLFLEPEGRTTVEYYLNGFSSSLPDEIQIEALHRIIGLEKARIFRPGYAIEYDYFYPSQLNDNLESKIIENLFFAGQVNGTTGYEEAAAQGLMAGINAHLKSHGLKKFTLSRSEAYIGVLIDDLITKELNEPYRLFTSRAEFRTLLRQDNADFRLTPLGYSIGLVSNQQWINLCDKYRTIQKILQFLEIDNILQLYNYNSDKEALPQNNPIINFLVQPGVSIYQTLNNFPNFKQYVEDLHANEEEIEEAEIIIKYYEYIQKEIEVANRIKKFENLYLSPLIDYSLFPSLTIEAREKLNKIKPSTLGQASRISGVSPSDLSFLLIYLNKNYSS
ncbi:MAG TPA: tRNA uridine-5-carboxymethylaminomethyl(34) synthesis enzyme MnmG [Bacteroidales bacterium]|jgi:tRNA uridine 5-carboxymethylaminomethyl modification enzyme|nr:MAG: tRNA uridine 5-carboxymethylaminomethyl modification enzyme MnmG [Bacteroidetes bacterium ADurb.Bin012]HNQ59839.1 tRNA uridine-5-carboxymethylaminomethyl(34) synthesis enzyme MnmG [Bacteroidales bacterium]HNU21428.1 tRNA uridine-5-carboxymethylaminomethyl(34) synthesis enzyme MnmG [Bacteroidales bacterium]HNV16966.1 tRNA uridine-5-carboxymethylaminomethyl(34) synthesis enzyme MnmG [Bacteroidales bacterium]HNZ79100.1 tRNA uridine-5-carboxymethylaminomethyl(34) synthesis enzyme MnmG [Bact